MNIDLYGKTALVSGSTSGIGFAIAKGLAQSGAEVAVNGRTQANVDKAVAADREIVAGGEGQGYRRRHLECERAGANPGGAAFARYPGQRRHLRAEGLLRNHR